MTERRRVSPEPWEPIKLNLDDPRVLAIKSLARGAATQGQQILAWETILFHFCNIRDLSFRPGGPDGDRATTFAEGRRFVGLQLAKTAQLVAVNQNKTRGPEPAEPTPTTE